MKKNLVPVLTLLALAALPAIAQNSTTLPFTFSVPGHVAKRGVFVSLFGQYVGENTVVSSGDPWVFAWNSANATTYSTTSTSVSTYTPATTTVSYNGQSQWTTNNTTTQIYVPTGATTLFPNPGNLTLTNGTTTIHATYNGTTNNTSNGNPDWFNNVHFTEQGVSFSSNWTVYSSDGPASSGTAAFATTTNVIFVDSVAGFPSSGSLTLVSGTVALQASYNGTSAGNSSSTPPATPSFTGVSFTNKNLGFAPGYSVSPGNILSSTIGLNSTVGLPSSGLLMLQTPAGVIPSKNIVVSYSGISGNFVTGVEPFPSGGNFTESLSGGGPAFLMPSGNLTVSYAQASAVQGANVPMVSLFPPGTVFEDGLTYNATLTMPDYTTNGILSGVAVMSIGTAAALPVPPTGTATIGSPTPGTIPNDIFGIFEWGLVNTGSGLDFDVSEVDQVGFPFRSTTLGAQPALPADPVLGVGMLQDRETLFAGFETFLNSLPAGSNATVFLQGRAGNPQAPFPPNTRITAPQDIIGILQGQAPTMGAALPAIVGNLTVNSTTTAYYAVTATTVHGESMVSNVTSGTNGAAATGLQVSWTPYPYATGYNLYWSSNADFSNPILIASTTGNGNTTYTDASPWSHNGTAATLPLNNYNYDPLNKYLTPVIKDFFDYYSANTFILDDQATKTTWTGTVGNATMLGKTYRMLQLTGSAGQWGGQFVGKTLNILEPFFSSNTDNSSNPPPPIISNGDDVTTLDPYQQAYIETGTLVLTQNGNVWQYSGSGPKNAQGSYTGPVATGQTSNMTLKVYESPSAMVFGADGVFGNFVGNGTTLDIGDAKDVYNNIASALNRGITPRYVSGNWTNIIPPNYWASDYLVLNSANATSGGNLTAGAYRYWITAYGVLGDNSTQETTPGNVLPVTLSQNNQSIVLGWNAVNGPGSSSGAATATGFNIYRSQQVSGNWTAPGLVGTVSNNSTTPVHSFTDTGGNATTPPPNQWYRPGTLSNFYAAYFTQYDVSINGLSYGFAYGDKGGLSTNVQMNPVGVTALVITLNPWTAAPTPPGLPTIEVNGVLNPFSTTNGTASAAQSFTASGSNLLVGITLTAPEGFELSTTGVGAFSSNLTLSLSGDSVPITNIYTRLSASTAVGVYSGNISLSSTNATTQNVAVSGNVTTGGTPYENWVSYWTTQNPSFSGNSSGTGDPDGDGFVNDTEFAFDGNPTVPTAALLSSSTSGGNLTVSFIARNSTPPGATYQVQESTNLNNGFISSNVTVSESSDQSGILVAAQYQRRQFSVPMSEDKKFYRIQATLVGNQ